MIAGVRQLVASRWRFVTLAVLLLMGGCEAAYYDINERFGILKNDILVDRVEDAMDAQEEAKQEFKDAFEQFEAAVGVPDSELKTVYRRLNGAFEDAQDKAGEVSSRIESVEDVSEDLFDEWQEELEQISNQQLKSQSASQLRTSKRRYDQLIAAMRAAESRMQPVLTSFNDHVLFLKHNLNAQAIASLKSELGSIESDVGRLIADMERSIEQAQSFIKDMSAS